MLLLDEKLIHLDPHCSQNCVDVLQDNFPLEVSLSKTPSSFFFTFETSFLGSSLDCTA